MRQQEGMTPHYLCEKLLTAILDQREPVSGNCRETVGIDVEVIHCSSAIECPCAGPKPIKRVSKGVNFKLLPQAGRQMRADAI
jgi:hypothetical protein